MTKKHSNILRLPFLLLLSLMVFAPAGVQAREMEELPVVRLQSLDKITARTQTFEANVGSTVKFGPLFIKVQACREASPVEQPESAAFLQVWEVTPEEEAEWIFSGWMFASSPGLSHMDHPIYDVWVLDCMDQKAKTAALEDTDKGEDAAAADIREGEGELAEDEAPAQPELDSADVIVDDQNMPEEGEPKEGITIETLQ